MLEHHRNLSGWAAAPIALAPLLLSLTAFTDASFVLVLACGGIAYELWTAAGRYSRRLHALSPLPAAVVFIAGLVTVSLTCSHSAARSL